MDHDRDSELILRARVPQTTGTFISDLDQGVHLFWTIALPVSCELTREARFTQWSS